MSELPPAPTDPTPPRGIPIHDLQPEAPLPVIITAPPPQQRLFGNPQILAAVITGIISLAVAVVGIIPALVKDDDDPAPTPTVLAALMMTFTPTDVPASAPTDVPTIVPTDTAAASVPTIVSVGQTTPLPVIGATAMPEPTTEATAAPSGSEEPNVRLYFDNASFTIRNQGGGKKTLEGVVFYSDQGRWEASQWGLIHKDLSNRDCLRLRDQSTEPRNPPSDCRELLALLLVGPAAIFWRDNDGFRVERNGVLLGTCTESPCDLYLPRD